MDFLTTIRDHEITRAEECLVATAFPISQLDSYASRAEGCVKRGGPPTPFILEASVEIAERIEAIASRLRAMAAVSRPVTHLEAAE